MMTETTNPAREEILDTVGEFTWCFGRYFFVELPFGNYEWSNPDYDGDNTFKRFKGSWDDYLSANGIHSGRSKGSHKVSDYCGKDITLIDT